MIEDGFADDIEVETSYLGMGIILISVDIIKPDGINEVFEVVWDGQRLRRA